MDVKKDDDLFDDLYWKAPKKYKDAAEYLVKEKLGSVIPMLTLVIVGFLGSVTCLVTLFDVRPITSIILVVCMFVFFYGREQLKFREQHVRSIVKKMMRENKNTL